MLKKKLLTDRTGDLQQAILDNMAMQIQQDMDREILWSMLSEMGWTRVMLDSLQSNTHAVDIKYWLENNITGAYECRGRDFIFENKKDAAWFTLRWM